MGELSPWRSVLPPRYDEGNAFDAGGGKDPAAGGELLCYPPPRADGNDMMA